MQGCLSGGGLCQQGAGVWAGWESEGLGLPQCAVPNSHHTPWRDAVRRWRFMRVEPWRGQRPRELAQPLSRLWEVLKDGEAWRAAVHRARESDVTEQPNTAGLPGWGVSLHWPGSDTQSDTL